jgi:hypothetical protein
MPRDAQIAFTPSIGRVTMISPTLTAPKHFSVNPIERRIIMEKTAVFTITKDGKLYNLKCKAFNTYNRIGITQVELFNEMEYLTDTFNNLLNVGILFEIA